MSDIKKLRLRIYTLQDIYQREKDEDRLIEIKVELDYLWTEYAREQLKRENPVILIDGNTSYQINTLQEFYMYVMNNAYDVSHFSASEGKIFVNHT